MGGRDYVLRPVTRERAPARDNNQRGSRGQGHSGQPAPGSRGHGPSGQPAPGSRGHGPSGQPAPGSRGHGPSGQPAPGSRGHGPSGQPAPGSRGHGPSGQPAPGSRGSRPGSRGHRTVRSLFDRFKRSTGNINIPDPTYEEEEPTFTPIEVEVPRNYGPEDPFMPAMDLGDVSNSLDEAENELPDIVDDTSKPNN